MRGKWSAVSSVVVVVDGYGRRNDQQLAKLFPRRYPNRRRFGHRRPRRGTNPRETGRGTGVHRGQIAATTAGTSSTAQIAAATTSTNATTSNHRRKNVVVLTDVGDCGDCPSSRWFLRAGTVVRLDDLVRDQVLGVSLFPAVHHVLWKVKPSGRRSSDDRVMAGRGVGHLHGAKLQERFTEGHPTEE